MSSKAFVFIILCMKDYVFRRTSPLKHEFREKIVLTIIRINRFNTFRKQAAKKLICEKAQITFIQNEVRAFSFFIERFFC
jgi:hypothetical protein